MITLKSLLKKVKEESEKLGFKLNIREIKIMASGPIIMANRREKSGRCARLYFLGLQSHRDSDCSHEIKRGLLLERKAMKT